jgi:hypothetical protein
MVEDSKDAALQILTRLLEQSERREEIAGLPKTITIHAVERSRKFGEGRALEGVLVIEAADGRMHRVTGKELAALNVIAPDFLKYWRLDQE